MIKYVVMICILHMYPQETTVLKKFERDRKATVVVPIKLPVKL